MKPLIFKSLIFFGSLLIFSAAFVNAQNIQERPPVERPNVRPQRLLEQLNLSREQIQQIRRIYEEKQPLIREAQDRLRDTNRALDLAIYADTANEEEIKKRMNEVQMAQAEVVKLRSTTEFEVRKVLTPEQLAKFRKLREDFAQQTEQRRMENEERQNQRRNDQNPRQRRNNRRNF